MGMEVKVAPSILSCDFSRLADEVKAVEEAGADLIHIDVMDGIFVPNITVGPVVVEAVRRVTSLPLDVHLMITSPERYIERFVDAGADILTVHYEASIHIHRTLSRIRELGAKSGVSINPGTPVSVLEDVLDVSDLVLIMTVNPGFGGQKVIPEAISKLDRLEAMVSGRDILVEVDGGINRDTVHLLEGKRVDIVVSGSGVFGEKDYKKAIEGLKGVGG